ncbi:MAG: cryptochrome/photolyase family protein [Deltaproteobacteria bacterium]|nr:MAG: cryptochrome/photolyase family protein [Deltaproteobacteria bacterium]
MSVLRFVLGDQLTHSLSSLKSLDKDNDTVLMVEVQEEATYVKHHPKKIAFLFSAMRHFAEELEEKGVTVRYIRLTDKDNTHSFRGELCRAVDELQPERVEVCEPGEYRVLEDMGGWEEACGVPVSILPDDRFYCSLEEFADWAEGRKLLRMEHFYRQMRKNTGVLMEGGKPVGGKWNYDKQNRKSLPKQFQVPPRMECEPDAITQEVLDLVAERFESHFGTLDHFWFATTRDDALACFEDFITRCLNSFGDYQDAMAQDQPFLYHSLISMYLNAGLLTPHELVERAEEAHQAGQAPLNAVEGFIRQIMGWREYVRGIYWLKMPDYAETNTLEASRPLPEFYWTGETRMNCLSQAIKQTHDEAYAHHIQRLMVTGNFALVAGVTPKEVCEWYLLVYADAFEWVELPNTHGMALYADGGFLGSKPYAASGKYIDRMSNYCSHCTYDVKESTGEKACPFNYLYWKFLMENQERLQGNQRMSLIYSQMARMSEDKLKTMAEQAEAFLADPDAY